MSEHEAESVGFAEIHAVVTRADGTIEDLGMIASSLPIEHVEEEEVADGDGLQ